MMSAPASRYSRWIPATIAGWVRVSRSLLPCRSRGPVREPLAAVAGLGRTVALDRGAHRAVDDQDPLAQGGGQRLGGVGTPVSLGAHGASSPRVGATTAAGAGAKPTNSVHVLDCIPAWWHRPRRDPTEIARPHLDSICDRAGGHRRPGGPGRHRGLRGLERRRRRRLLRGGPPDAGLERQGRGGDRPRRVLRLPGQPADGRHRPGRAPADHAGRAPRSRSRRRPTSTATSSCCAASSRT